MQSNITGNLLSDSDVGAMERLLAREQSTVPQRSKPIQWEDPLLQTPDVYLGYAPVGGIPGWSSSPGSGSVDQAAQARNCTLYRISQSGSLSGDIMPVGIYRPVFNLTATEITAGTLFLAIKDKTGKWIAVPLSAGSSEGGTNGTGARLYTTSNITVPHTTGVNISFGNQDYDMPDWWVVGSPDEINVTGGLYICGTQGTFTNLLNGESGGVQITTPSTTYYGGGGGIAIGYGGGFVAQPSLQGSTSFRVTGTSALIQVKAYHSAFFVDRTLSAGFVFWIDRIGDGN